MDQKGMEEKELIEKIRNAEEYISHIFYPEDKLNKNIYELDNFEKKKDI